MASNSIKILIEARDEASAVVARSAQNIKSSVDQASKSTSGLGEASQITDKQLEGLNGRLLIAKQRLTDAQASGTASATSMLQMRKSVLDLEDQVRSSNGILGGFNSGLANTAQMVKGVAIAYVTYGVGQLIGDFVTNIVGTAAALEQTNLGFQSMIGNAQEANKTFADLVQYANVTPFTSTEIIQSARTLMTAKLSGDELVKTMKEAGDVVSASGGNMSQFSLVLSQALGKGKLDTRDFYQFVDAGGTALMNMLADQHGGMANFMHDMEQGKVKSQELKDAMQKATSEGGFAFEGAQKQANTFNGQVSTLKDTVTQFGMRLMGVKIDPKLGYVIEKGGLFDQAKDIVHHLNDEIQKLDPAQVMSGIKMTGSILGVMASYVLLRSTIKAVNGVINDVKTAWTVAATVGSWAADTSAAKWILSASRTAYAWAGTKLLMLESYVAMAASSAVQAAASAVSWVTSSATAGGAVTALRALVSSPITMGAIAVAGAIADVYLVMKAVQTVQAAIQAMDQAAQAAAQNAQTSAQLMASANSGKYSPEISAKLRSIASQPVTKAPSNGDYWNAAVGSVFSVQGWQSAFGGHASGTAFAPGGLTWVGENGPELMDVQRGARIANSDESRRIASGANRGGAGISIGQVHIHNELDETKFLRKMGFMLTHGVAA